MAVPQSPTLELKDHDPPSSVHPQEKQSLSCVPHSADSCSSNQCGLSQGKEGSLTAVLLLAGPPLVAHSCSGLQFMATPSWKPTPRLADCSQLPWSNAWGLCRTQAPTFFVCRLGSWDHAVPPRILPCLVTWAPFRQGCPALEQTSKSSGFVLHCCITFQ